MEMSEISNNEENIEDEILQLQPTNDLIDAAPPEDLSDEEIFDSKNKLISKKTISDHTSAGRLQSRVPDAPENLIDLIYRKKCVECNSILNTISSALMHYNSTKHQNKLAFLFLPNGTYNLPLSKEEIREIETGIVKTGEPNSIAQNRARNIPFRDLVKKFEIVEDVRKLDLEFCRLCEMPFSSKVAALQHYSGKKHKKNAENWSPYNPPKPIDTKDDLRCDACNIIVGSSLQMETHVSGKRHQMKMQAYLTRVNAGAIAPPMSSRGFCDFNNVEREEANPVDPSRFMQQDYTPIPPDPIVPPSQFHFIPENPAGSFLNAPAQPYEYSTTSSYSNDFIKSHPRPSEVPSRQIDPYDSPESYYNSPAYGPTSYDYNYSSAADSSMYGSPWPAQKPPVYGGSIPINHSGYNRPRAPIASNFGPTKFTYNRK